MSLTESQLQKKAEVEAAGGVFLHPQEWKKQKSMSKKVGKKAALKTQPNQIATYAAKKAYKSEFKEIAPETSAVIEQILDPESANDLCRWPNTYGLSAVYKTKNVSNALFDVNGRSMVAVEPRLNNSIYTTCGATFTQSLSTNAAANNNPFSFNYFSLPVNTAPAVFWTSPIVFNNNHVVLPQPNSTVNAMVYAIGNPVTNATSFMSFYFPLSVQGMVQVKVSFFNASFVQVGATSVATTNSSLIATISMNVTGNLWNYFTVQVSALALPFEGTAQMAMYDTSGSASLVLPNLSQHCLVTSLNNSAAIEQNSTMDFIAAQSLLLTFEGSSLQNGGQLAIARLPGSTVVGQSSTTYQFNSWYDWLASLPYDNYDGPTRKGGYGFYLGQDETSYFYNSSSDFVGETQLPYMAAEFTTDSTESIVVRIKICTVVQFRTTNSSYQQGPACYIGDEIYKLHHILSSVPPCYSNEGHVDGIKKHLAKIGNKVVKLLKNPKTYINAGKLAAMLATILI